MERYVKIMKTRAPLSYWNDKSGAKLLENHEKERKRNGAGRKIGRNEEEEVE